MLYKNFGSKKNEKELSCQLIFDQESNSPPETVGSGSTLAPSKISDMEDCNFGSVDLEWKQAPTRNGLVDFCAVKFKDTSLWWRGSVA